VPGKRSALAVRRLRFLEFGHASLDMH
jgi:hypothetical protein